VASRLPRNRATAALVALVLSLFIAAPAAAQTSNTTGAITGTVHDLTGAPVADASVALQGPAHYATRTDSGGAFSFTAVTPGVYSISIVKAGYTSASQSDIAVLAGQTQTLTVQMERLTFSSLRTIAAVRVRGSGTINTTPAAVNIISPQEFVNQAQPQVTRILNQVPGVQISLPSNSANGASPGSITVPNIRNALSYETASLIDGHPISVGQYGDNVTTFLNSFMFGNVEVIKGPGATSPVVNNAIGGTVNFRTKEPTLQPQAQLLFGFDNRGGALSNFSYSNTIGRLGIVADVASNNNPSALYGKQIYYDPSGGIYAGGTLDGNTSFGNIGNTASSGPLGFPLVACCYTVYGSYDQTAELLKARYKVSPATALTVSYLAGQTDSDQSGNTGSLVQGQFTPGPGYTGPLTPGTMLIGSSSTNIFPGAYNGEHNIEPIFQAEVSTTLNNDTVLARYYHASILRYQFQGGQNAPDFNAVTLYGTSTVVNPGDIAGTFNGTGANVGFNDYYQEPELDKLSGGTFEYQHPLASGSLTFSVDRTYSQSTDYSVFPGPFYSFNLPPGTNQMLTTYLLRGQFDVTRRLNVTFSNYFNTYLLNYPLSCAGGCNTFDAAVNGTGVTFGTTRTSHYDPRIALVYRPSVNSSVRFAAGSAIAPPFLGLFSPSAPSYTGNNYAVETVPNSALKPETAFGWDLGGDIRLADGVTLVSGDLYLTNLFNRFFNQSYNTGQFCSSNPNDPNYCTSFGPVPPNTPILNSTPSNISNARFEGIELTVRRAPPAGFGYTLEGSLQRGYYYNLPPFFYCQNPGPGCTMNQNLNIISGQNTNGIPVGFYQVSFSGNMRIPYAQGNAEINYTWRNGAYAEFGDTYYGKNNSLNEPPFAIAYASLRYPVTPHVALQLSGDNLFNAYKGVFPIYGGGVPIPLANGQVAATSGNVLGPATYRLTLITNLP